MVALFCVAEPNTSSRVETFVTIANEIPALAMMAVGMTFVLIIAGIDLSVGSVMALARPCRPPPSLQWQLAGAAGGRAGARPPGLVCGHDQRRDVGGLAAAVVHRHAGHARSRRAARAYVVTDSRTQYVGDAIAWLGSAVVRRHLVAAFVHRDRASSSWRSWCSRARCSAAA